MWICILIFRSPQLRFPALGSPLPRSRNTSERDLQSDPQIPASGGLGGAMTKETIKYALPTRPETKAQISKNTAEIDISEQIVV